MTGRPARAVRRAAAVLAVLAFGAVAVACDPAPRPGQTGPAGPATRGVATKGVARDSPLGSRAGLKKSAAGDRCLIGELSLGWGSAHGGRPDMETGRRQTAVVRLKNTGGRTCGLHGFPGVRLISESGEYWDLVRSAARPGTVSLRPGDDTALITMNMLPVGRDDADAKAFVPDKVLITPPGGTAFVTLSWPYGGAVLDQSTAPHPATSVNPVALG